MKKNDESRVYGAIIRAPHLGLEPRASRFRLEVLRATIAPAGIDSWSLGAYKTIYRLSLQKVRCDIHPSELRLNITRDMTGDITIQGHQKQHQNTCDYGRYAELYGEEMLIQNHAVLAC